MIGIFCNDAGSANVISNYVINNKNNYIFCITGPAKKIFQKNLLKFKNQSRKDIFKSSKKIIVGNSWKTNYLLNIFLKAKKDNIKIILSVDHFGDEFIADLTFSDNNILSPDEIWLSYKESKNKIKKQFKNSKVLIKKNYYIEGIKKQIQNNYIKNLKLKRKIDYNRYKILYICEPIEDHFKFKYFKNKKNYSYTEEDAINFFFKNIHKINKNIESICFRPHPSENKKKYCWVKKKYSKYFSIKIFKDSNLINQIMNYDCLVGCNSLPLIMGIFAKKRVISNIPINNIKTILPFKQIEDLKKIK